MPSSPRLSRRVAALHASPIRALLAAIDRPGMISFAGGLPATDALPRLDPASVPQAWLQYGPSEGEGALRERIARTVRESGLDCAAAQVIVLSGSQQGIDLAAKLIVDPGTPVGVEAPTYLAALQVFRFFGARLQPLPRLEEARVPDAAAALAYVNPSFQNPTGHCYSAAQRAALARACDAHGTVLFEDDPYRDLAYEPCERRPVCALLEKSSWIYQGSFSKTFAPGLRLGYLVASPDLVRPLSHLKQAADLHSNRLSQWFVLRHLEDPGRAAHLARLIAAYRSRRDAFDRALAQHLGALARWRTPAGGLFFWLELEGTIDTRTLLDAALAQGVAYMPGEAFYPDFASPRSSIRLNFSHASPAQARRGLARLAHLLRAAGISSTPRKTPDSNTVQGSAHAS